MSTRKPYVRSMDGWWRKNPYYVRYMIMEATSVIVALYAAILLVGLWRLSQGPAAFVAWLATLQSVPAVLLHCVLFGAFVYHAYTWWSVLPKTLPLIRFNGKLVPGLVLSGAGWAATAAASAAVLAIAGWW